MDQIIILVVLINLIQIGAYALYNKDILRNRSVPNRASWGIWAFITILNFTSYGSMSKDWMKSLLPTISSILCVLTFVLTFFKQKKVKFSRWDLAALGLGLLAGLIWFLLKSATYANLILQFALTIGFVPTIRCVYKNPKSEKSLSWFLWSCAFLLSIVVVISRWNGQWQELVYPTNALLWHVVVWLLSTRKRFE